MGNKKFRVEMGINLHAAPITQTNPNMRLFPLQNALVDITGGKKAAKPAWYSHLSVGDEVSFRLVDITSLRAPGTSPEYPQLALAEFIFCDPLTGQETNPFEKEIIKWRFSDRLKDRRSPVYSQPQDVKLPTWNFLGHDKKGKEHKSLKLAECGGNQELRAFELTVAIRFQRDGWVNHYVFDPEMIISETDNEGK